MFTFKYLPSIAALCAAAAAPAQAILETFANATQQDAQVSSGVWSGGARPGLIGGDGRHGPFYPFLGFALGGNVFELNTDHTVIPATTSSPCAFSRYSPKTVRSPVAGSRVKATPVPESSPMLPYTIETTFTPVPRCSGIRLTLR